MGNGGSCRNTPQGLGSHWSRFLSDQDLLFHLFLLTPRLPQVFHETKITLLSFAIRIMQNIYILYISLFFTKNKLISDTESGMKCEGEKDGIKRSTISSIVISKTTDSVRLLPRISGV